MSKLLRIVGFGVPAFALVLGMIAVYLFDRKFGWELLPLGIVILAFSLGCQYGAMKMEKLEQDPLGVEDE